MTLRAWLASACLLLGCGSNAPELPPDLVDAIRMGGGTDGGAYPPGPYGAAEGSVVRDACFEGWRNPLASNFDPAALEQICFADFYDPAGANTEILLVNTGALWCTACKTEWGGSADRPSILERQDALADQGFHVFGLFFQDAAENPADVDVIRSWATTFAIDVPFARDPDFIMDTYADANVQPFNMLVDARTMKILSKVDGDQPDVLFSRVQQELAARAGS